MNDPSQPTSRYAAALSTATDWREALEEVCQRVRAQLVAPPNLAFLFLSADRAQDAAEIAHATCDALGTEQLLGCTAESIVGPGQEVEWAPALSLWAASLTGDPVRTMHLHFQHTPDGGTFLGWSDELLGDWPAGATLISLADPFSFPADAWLERLNDDHPGTAVLGGMSSGGAAPRENRLLLGRRALAEGAVVAMLPASTTVRPVVSQGCRPIGRPLVVTKAERNLILQLGGVPALDRLREIFEQLPNREKQMVQQGLHVGRVVSEYLEQFEQGDFLVRNVLGVDPEQGAVAIGDYVRAGQTVQFHVRDQETADAEMRGLLSRAVATTPAAAALLFTCNGRGTRLFAQPHHDAETIRRACGDIPVAGFFAQGEIGPIGGRNFLHGFTASTALFD